MKSGVIGKEITDVMPDVWGLQKSQASSFYSPRINICLISCCVWIGRMLMSCMGNTLFRGCVCAECNLIKVCKRMHYTILIKWMVPISWEGTSSASEDSKIPT